MDTPWSGLPTGLLEQGGPDLGLSILAITAESLAAEASTARAAGLVHGHEHRGRRGRRGPRVASAALGAPAGGAWSSSGDERRGHRAAASPRRPSTCAGRAARHAGRRAAYRAPPAGRADHEGRGHAAGGRRAPSAGSSARGPSPDPSRRGRGALACHASRTLEAVSSHPCPETRGAAACAVDARPAYRGPATPHRRRNLMDTHLMLGNEAVARGAWEAGVQVAAAYPGTPSTEIVTNLARYDGVYAEWSTNEKVAYEVAFGAAMGGARALTAMKSAGGSVAADPLISSVYTGVNGGLVVCLAGDPGMASGMTEQDDRYFGRISSMPMLEPADSQECYEYAKRAFAMSEEFDVPVMVRLSIQTAHQKSIVRFDGEVAAGRRTTRRGLTRPAPERRPPDRKTEKYCLLPKFSRPLHRSLLERVERLYAVRRGERGLRRPGARRAGRRPGAAAGRRHGEDRRRLRRGGVPQRQRGAARRRLPQARHDPPAAGRGHPRVRADRRPAVRGRGARAVPGGADPRGRHRLRGQAVVPAVGRADGRAGGPGLLRRRPRPPALGGGEGRGGRHRHPAAARALHRLPAPRHGHGDEEARPRRARRHRLLRPHDPAAGEPHALRRRDGRQHPDGAGLHARRRQRAPARSPSSATRPSCTPASPACSTPCTSAPTSPCSSRTTASRP